MNEQRRPRPDEIAATLAAGAAIPSRRKWLIWGGGGAIALIVLVAILLSPKPVKYKTDAVTRGPFTEIVTATGTVQPYNTVQVGSEISGRIAAVLVDYNDAVKTGDVLARIDTTELEARIKQTEAALLSAQASLLEAQANAREAASKRDRAAALQKKGNVSTQDLETAQATLERADASVVAAQGQIKSAEAALDIEKNNLDRAVIRAPIDGVVLERDIEPGQTVAASFQTPILFKLAEDLTRMTVEADIDEADVGAVQQGQSATFTVDAYAERKFKATVRSLRFAPVTTNGVVTYKAILDAPNADLTLRPGMTATAEIVVARNDDMLLAPSGALRFTPPDLVAQIEKPAAGNEALPELKAVPLKGNEAGPAAKDYGIVWVLKDGKPRPVAVKAGASDGLRTAIVAGALTPGDLAIVDIAREKAKKPAKAP